MAKIELNNDQLRLIQKALDFYSRMGTLQFEELLKHPTINDMIYSQFTPKKELQVGDDTMRGEIVEIGEGYIKTKGSWGKGEEIKKWKDIDKIKLSPDWTRINKLKDDIERQLRDLKTKISGENFGNGSYGIGSKKVDNSCRDAFDLLQVIRHEFWKDDPKKSYMTVDSSITLMNYKNSDVKVELDTIKDIRKRKLKNIKK